MTRPTLKGVSIIYDAVKKKHYVKIDLATLAKEPDAVEDLLDGLVAESRRGEPSVSQQEVERQLQAKRKRK